VKQKPEGISTQNTCLFAALNLLRPVKKTLYIKMKITISQEFARYQKAPKWVLTEKFQKVIRLTPPQLSLPLLTPLSNVT
jgi:hypothetical protein